MKNGFTLIELLIVITLVATISVSSMIIFDQTQATTNEEKLVRYSKSCIIIYRFK